MFFHKPFTRNQNTINEDDFINSLNIEQCKREIALKVRSTISEIVKVAESQIASNMKIKDLHESGWFRNWDDLDFRFRIERKLGVRVTDLHVELGKLSLHEFTFLGDLIIHITNMIYYIINRVSENQTRHASESD